MTESIDGNYHTKIRNIKIDIYASKANAEQRQAMNNKYGMYHVNIIRTVEGLFFVIAFNWRI